MNTDKDWRFIIKSTFRKVKSGLAQMSHFVPDNPCSSVVALLHGYGFRGFENLTTDADQD